MNTKSFAIGFDIDGTTTKMGIVNAKGAIEGPGSVLPTGDDLYKAMRSA
jgi:predicted NBD/HSP70 family sugar kinase